MKIIKDIYSNLNKTLDIKGIFYVSKAHVQSLLSRKSTKDIFRKKMDINLSKWVNIKLMKNSTKNFDSLIGKSLKEDVIIVKKKYSIIDKYVLYNVEKIQKKLSKKLKQRNIWFPVYILIFFLFAFSYVLISKKIIESTVNSAYKEIISIKESGFDLDKIQDKNNSAHRKLKIAKILFIPYFPFSNSKLEDARSIINGWLSITSSINDFLLIWEDIDKYVASKNINEIMFSQLLKNIKPSIISLEKDIKVTIGHFKNITKLDADIKNKVDTWLNILEKIHSDVSTIITNYDFLLSLLWHDKEKKYLIVFQNSDEIRPTGWFMGSMGIISIFRGKVKSFEKKDVYAYEWDLKKSNYKKPLAPEWINKLTKELSLRDANYFINTRDSARSINLFIKEAWYQIDGIVFINQNIILDFLSLIEKVHFNEIQSDVTTSNFSTILSLLVEAKIFKEGTLWTPKKALFDFIDDFVATLKEKKMYGEYINIIKRNIDSGEIILYSFNKNENDFLISLWLGWEKKTPETLDYNYPVFTSISWNKSDRYIKRNFRKTFSVNKDTCLVNTSLKIIQKHTFTNDDEKYLTELTQQFWIEKTPSLMSIQGKWPNYQYVRVLIPKNAEVEKKDGLTVIDMENKKMVSFYIKTMPREINSYEIKYTLKNENCLPYTYSLLKQPGIYSYDISVNEAAITLKETWVRQDFMYTWENKK